MQLLDWLRDTFDDWQFTAKGVLVAADTDWPVTASTFDDLTDKLADADMLAPLPTESAALANIVEGEIRTHAIRALKRLARDGHDVGWAAGTDRGYPDLEVSGEAFGGGHHAVDVKVARLNKSGASTKSPITLYTGNTYFRYPKLHWPGVPRPFGEYQSHLDIVVLYRHDPGVARQVTHAEVIVQPAWRIASKQRSSGTREYIGAVRQVQRLRDGDGEFASAAEFYHYWRNYPFKLSSNAEKTLAKLLDDQP